MGNDEARGYGRGRSRPRMENWLLVRFLMKSFEMPMIRGCALLVALCLVCAASPKARESFIFKGVVRHPAVNLYPGLPRDNFGHIEVPQQASSARSAAQATIGAFLDGKISLCQTKVERVIGHHTLVIPPGLAHGLVVPHRLKVVPKLEKMDRSGQYMILDLVDNPFVVKGAGRVFVQLRCIVGYARAGSSILREGLYDYIIAWTKNGNVALIDDIPPVTLDSY